MAEASPLVNAHSNARKAAESISQSKWPDAAEKHSEAAVDFFRAAKSTSDGEALRILRLLEEQHRQLARLIRNEGTSKTAQEVATATTQVKVEARSEATKPDVPKHLKGTGNDAHADSESTTSRPDRSGCPEASSLARDMASRRGIPQSGRSVPSAAAQARARQISPEARRKAKSSASLPSSSATQSHPHGTSVRNVKKDEDDEGFARFYSNITTGTMSKLSSVLAYAGLPLANEDTPEVISSLKPGKRTVSAGNDPDVKKIFSKAALNAIEEEHRHRGTLGHGFGPAESFYVVQKGGGTYSYADIARAQQQQLTGIDDEDEETFVDAKEMVASNSPQHSRTATQRRASFGNARTQEELELENVTLKHTLEQLAGRLAEFETHAQDASMAALTQSMVHLGSQTTGMNAGVQERLRELERQLEQQTSEQQKLQSLAAKQEKMLKKYHAKWEQIKDSAREKDKAKRSKADKVADDVDAASKVS